MKIFNLPHDIFHKGHEKTDDIIFHHYKAPVASLKGKSMLHKNAISLVINGNKIMRFADKTVRINSNEIHFLSIGNCIVTMDFPKTLSSFESILIFFDNKILAGFYSKYKHRIISIRRKNTGGIETYFSIKKDEFIKSYIHSLQALFQSTAIFTEEMRILKFEELMLYLLEKHPIEILSFPINKNKDLEDLDIRKAIEANVLNNISLEELAFLCNLSLSTFKRRFIKLYGLSPGKWMLQRRMETAKALMMQHGERPADVYYKVGYENHSSFSQSFKQYFGISPKQFKRLNE